MDPKEIATLITEDPDVASWESECREVLKRLGHSDDKAYQKCAKVAIRAAREGMDERSFLRKIELMLAKERRKEKRDKRADRKFKDALWKAWKGR